MIENLHDAATRATEAVSTTETPTAAGLDVVARWPELFDGLDEVQRNAIRQTFAANWHKGWTPNREDVADLAAQTRGDITVDEYFRRADARAGRAAGASSIR